ncbi:MAG: hypothetical protein ACI9YP_001661 [Colwellia sp.]|jgi:hypothetical protein
MNQWLDKQIIAKTTYSDLKQRIDKNLIPYLDNKYINEYTTADVLGAKNEGAWSEGNFNSFS